MKRVFIALILFLSIQLVSSLNFEMKENFAPGETLIGSIEANFLSQIPPENVYFYSSRVSLPLFFDIARIQEKYYFYALLPLQERNYSLIIKNAHYLENGNEIISDLERNFSVSGNITEFSVYPGFIITKNNFTLAINSKNQARNLQIQVLNQTIQIQVPMSSSKKVDISVQSENFTLSSISVSSAGTKYEIPIAILPSSRYYFSENITDSEKFRFSKQELYLSLAQGSGRAYSIYLINTGSSEISNIQISAEGSIKNILSISPSELNLKESESKQINLTFSASQSGIFTGKITADSGNFSASSLVSINISSPENYNSSNSNIEIIETCMSYGGIICPSNQECKGSLISSLDGECCLSQLCEDKTSYTGIIIGILILIAVGIGIFFLYKKYKSSKSPSSHQILEKQSKDFEKRLGIESRGSLSRS